MTYAQLTQEQRYQISANVVTQANLELLNGVEHLKTSTARSLTRGQHRFHSFFR